MSRRTMNSIVVCTMLNEEIECNLLPGLGHGSPRRVLVLDTVVH
jgi:hypothetical protein